MRGCPQIPMFHCRFHESTYIRDCTQMGVRLCARKWVYGCAPFWTNFNATMFFSMNCSSVKRCMTCKHDSWRCQWMTALQNRELRWMHATLCCWFDSTNPSSCLAARSIELRPRPHASPRIDSSPNIGNRLGISRICSVSAKTKSPMGLKHRTTPADQSTPR